MVWGLLRVRTVRLAEGAAATSDAAAGAAARAAARVAAFAFSIESPRRLGLRPTTLVPNTHNPPFTAG